MNIPEMLEFIDEVMEDKTGKALTGKSGLTRRIRTVWIVLFNENVAKLVTAFPDRLGGL